MGRYLVLLISEKRKLKINLKAKKDNGFDLAKLF